MPSSAFRIQPSAFAAALVLAAASTLGDFVWAVFDVRHRVVYGLAHGAVICFCIGALIGIRHRRFVAGALAGPIVGVVAAAVLRAGARAALGRDATGVDAVLDLLRVPAGMARAPAARH